MTLAIEKGTSTSDHHPPIIESDLGKKKLFTRRRILTSLGAFAGGTYLTAKYNGTDLKFHEWIIQLDNVPEELRGLRICVPSDQHIGGSIDSVATRARIVIESLLSGVSSDEALILHPGDFVCGMQAGLGPTQYDHNYASVCEDLFSPLAGYDQYAVPGNHDVSNDQWETHFRPDIEGTRGVDFLDEIGNEKIIHKCGSQILVIGLHSTDRRLQEIGTTSCWQEVDYLIDQLVSGENDLNTVVTHNPDGLQFVLDRLIDRDISIETPTLFVAGHAHGAMINVPFVRDYSLAKAAVTHGRYSGEYGPVGPYAGTGNWKMYVSSGMGNRPELGYRLFADPEVVNLRVA